MKNILFITSDQHHWTTMGYNNPEVKTPNLDKLAARGMIFDRAYTVNPTCTPTRASWLTGLYPSQHGAYSLGTKLMENVPTINDSFRKSGMKSGLVGKAHFQPLLSTDEFTSLESYPTLHDLDFWRNYKEKFYGFDHVELARNHTDESHAGQHYAIWMEEKGYTNWRDYFVPNNPGQTVEGDKFDPVKT
jgi:arylsulfatase A-like enzyme